MTHKTILTASIAVAGLVLLPVSLKAMPQQTQSVGMHHMVTKAAPPVQAPKPESEPEQNKQPPAPSIPEYTPLSPKDALIKPEDLERWSHMNEAALAYNKTDTDKLVYIIESERGAVSPQGLFLVAKALADQKQMETAALYFFIGQLRLTFDATRWPVRMNADDLKRLNEDAKKTEDQSAPNKGIAKPRIDNPHAGVTALAESISHPILAWAMKDPKRLNSILEKVRIWDESAPYAYDPGYPLNEPIAFENWEKILPKIRDDYFLRMNNLTKALRKIKS